MKKQKTLEELINSKKFNWFKVLEKLIDNPSTIAKYEYALITKARDWPTCACGQLCKRLPQNDGGPEDCDLRALGIVFLTAIRLQQWEHALQIMNAIEKRTTKLLNEL